MSEATSTIQVLLEQNRADLLEGWLRAQLAVPGLRTDLIGEEELRVESERFLRTLQEAISRDAANRDVSSPQWAAVREFLAELSLSRATRGFTPTETATFVFSLKEALFLELRAQKLSGDEMADAVWSATQLIDALGLFTAEAYVRTREQVIQRQQEELLELSTPVVKLWEGVVAVPLIGTLDSARTQVVMESLLERILETDSAIAIIDITGVPTVDTLVAQHLLKTVAAARLMGADCIISGIRPQIAQTIVHLGLELNEVVTKSTLASALIVALQRTGFEITRRRVAAS